MFRAFVTSLVLLLAAPAWAAPDYFDLYVSKRLFDSDCTDSFNVPATVTGSILDTNDWDTPAEAINPDLNRRVGVQTSGSADGWCDSDPTLAKGTISVAGAAEALYFGPVNMPPQGLLLPWNFSTVVTNYSWDFIYTPLWDTTFARNYMSMTNITTTGALQMLVGPLTETSAQISASDAAPIPSGVPLYLRVDLVGTGSWVVDAELHPLKNFYEN